MASELGGVWRTIRGRRVFIKDGEDLATAMERSGKFKKTSDISREEYQRNRDNIDLDNRLKKDINNTDFDDKTLEIDKRIDVRNNAREYTGDTSKLEGKHIAGRESKAREIDKFNNEINPMEEWSDTVGDGYSDAQRKELDRIKKDLSRPYVEQPDGTYADPKSPFTKRTSSELRKQIKELEPHTQELQIGNRVVKNIGGGKYAVRNVGDEDDPMTDYSAYVYGFNAKMIIQNAREQGIVTDAPKTSKTTEAKVERFKERKGKTLDTMSKRQLAEKIVDDQIARGVIKSDNKELQIKRKMQDYSKSDLLDYFK